MASFDEYDFANDDRWKTIESNVYVPPGPDHDALLLRRKRRFYRDTIDPDYKWTDTRCRHSNRQGRPVRVLGIRHQQPVIAARRQNRLPLPPPLLPRPARAPPRHPSKATSTTHLPHPPPPLRPLPPASPRNNLRLGGLSLPVLLSYAQLVLHCIVVLLFPFVFLPVLSAQAAHTAYSYILYLSALAYTLHLIRTHSLPTSPYQQYFLRLLQDHHSHFLFYAFVCLSAPPNAIFLVPFTVRSALYVSGALSRLLPTYLSPTVSEKVVPLLNRVVGQAGELQRTNAILEITAGLYSIVMLFTSARSFFLVFLYFQYLRMRYLMSPDSQYAWAVVRATVERYVQAAWMPAVVKVGYEKLRMGLESMVDTQRMAGAGGGAGGMMSRCTVM